MHESSTHNLRLLRPYFTVVILFWIIAFILLLKMGYYGSFLFLNEHHSSLLDLVMPHLTHIGDSLILSALVLIFVSRINSSLALTIVISIILSGLVLVSLKNFVFPDWHRPLKVLGENSGIHFVEGHVEYKRAFPSGHTTTIFSAFAFFAFLFRKKGFQILVGIAAILFCYTRIYLGSHFLGDVLAGSILGTFFAVLSLKYIYPAIKKSLDTKGELVQKKIKIIAMILGIMALALGISLRYIF